MARQGKGSGKQGGKGSKSLAVSDGVDTKAPEAEATPTKQRTSVPEFVRQVRQETAKVTWPTRKETTVTTIMVFIMVLLAAIFFFVVDQVISFVLRLIF